jgi:hypothetical protein
LLSYFPSFAFSLATLKDILKKKTNRRSKMQIFMIAILASLCGACTVIDCESTYGSLAGTCLVWTCAMPGNSCVIAAAPVGHACVAETRDGCLGAGPPSVPIAGECSNDSTCIVSAPAYPSAQCGDGMACVATANSTFNCTPISPGCTADEDCPGAGIADGCYATRCLNDTHTCGLAVLEDGTECVPTGVEGEAQLCSAGQTGVCLGGLCLLGSPDPLLYCTTDAACTGAACNSTGGCSLLSGAGLLCSATLPACADAATAVCNGWGFCAWTVSATCHDGNPCTLDVCDAVTGLCSNPVDPDACTTLTAVGVAVTVGIALAVSAVFIGSLLGLIWWRGKRRAKKML